MELARHAARELLYPQRARRPGGRRGHLRPGRSLGPGAQRRARGEPPPAAPAERPGLHAQPRLRLGQPGHHRRGRPDRARATPTSCSPAAPSRCPTFRSCTRAASAGSLVAACKAKSLGGRVAAFGADPPARPGAGHARHRRAVHRRDDGPVGREDGQGERHPREEQDRARAAVPPARRRRHRRRPAHRRDRALVRRRRPWIEPIAERQRHPRRHLARGARGAQAGVRPALRHGHRRQLLAAHRRRRRGAPDERGEGARRSATSRSPTSGATPSPRWIPGWQLLMGPVLRGAQGARARGDHAGATSD